MSTEKKDHYEIHHPNPIWQSCSGILYAGMRWPAGVPVELKTARPVEGADELDQARLVVEREYRILSGLSHPNIVSVHDRFTRDGAIWFARERVDGVSFDTAFWRAPARGLTGFAASIFRQLQSALDHLHARAIVLDSMFPSELLITESGALKIVDLEDCRVLGVDVQEYPMVGNAAYCAPEHVRGAPVVVESNYFTVGTLLHEYVSGRRPLQLDGVRWVRALAGLDTEHLARALARVDGALRDILTHLWALEPSTRREGWEMLRAATHEAPLEAVPDPPARFDEDDTERMTLPPGISAWEV